MITTPTCMPILDIILLWESHTMVWQCCALPSCNMYLLWAHGWGEFTCTFAKFDAWRSCTQIRHCWFSYPWQSVASENLRPYEQVSSRTKLRAWDPSHPEKILHGCWIQHPKPIIMLNIIRLTSSEPHSNLISIHARVLTWCQCARTHAIPEASTSL